MTDYLRHLAAKNLNLEKGVAPRLPAFFEPAAYAGTPFIGSTYLAPDPVPGEREGQRIEPRTSSRVASNTTSDRSPISGQSEGAHTNGSLPLIPAKPGIGFRDASPSMKINSLSSGFTERVPNLNPAQREYPVRIKPQSRQRKFGLDYKQVPFAARTHISDTAGKKREPRRRVRWETAFAHQQPENSLRSQRPPEQKSRHTKEDPGYAISSKKTRLVLANAADLSEAQDSSKGKGDESDSLFEGRFRSSHSVLRKANNSNQRISRSIEITGSTSAGIQPGSANEQSFAGTPEQPFPNQSLPSSNSRPKIADFRISGKTLSPLPEALFGVAKGGENESGSAFGGGFRSSHSVLRKVNDSGQRISRSIEMTGSPVVVIHPGTVNEQSAAGTPEQLFPNQSLPSSNSKPKIADFRISGKTPPSLPEALFGSEKGENNKSGSALERRITGTNFKLRKANNTDQKTSRSIEITGSPVAVIHPGTVNEQSAAGTPEQALLDPSLPFSELGFQIANLAMERQERSHPVRATSISSMPYGRRPDGISVAGELEARKTYDPHQEAARNPGRDVSAPLNSNGMSTIQVTIGRIEVRAEKPRQTTSAPPVCRPASAGRLSLDEYLKQRSTGQL